jgi:RNA polymerase II subunit A small phosphatase-like protein
MDRKTVIFDLDETLVHCSKKSALDQNASMLNFTAESGKKVSVPISVRPYAKEVLSMLNENFEVIVFTASMKNYADAVIDLLDPLNCIEKKRLYR